MRRVDCPRCGVTGRTEKEHAQAQSGRNAERRHYQPVVHRTRLSAPGAPWPIAAMRSGIDRQREAGDLLLRAAPCRRQIPDVSESDFKKVLTCIPPVVSGRGLVSVGTTILSEATREYIIATSSRMEAAGSVEARTRPRESLQTTERVCTSFHTPHRPCLLRDEIRTSQFCWAATRRFCEEAVRDRQLHKRHTIRLTRWEFPPSACPAVSQAQDCRSVSRLQAHAWAKLASLRWRMHINKQRNGIDASRLSVDVLV